MSTHGQFLVPAAAMAGPTGRNCFLLSLSFTFLVLCDFMILTPLFGHTCWISPYVVICDLEAKNKRELLDFICFSQFCLAFANPNMDTLI